MKKINLTDKEREQLKKIHKYTYNNSMRENRIKVVLLGDKDMSREEIRDILLLDLQTIRRYINEFVLYRMDSIDFEDRRKTKSGNTKDITPQQEEQVKKYAQDNLIEDAKEIQHYIHEQFNIFYAIPTVTKLLHDLGFVYKKVVTIPQKANTIESLQKQLEFEEKYKHLKEVLKQEDTMLFLDGVHPTHNTQAGFAWIEKGKAKIIQSNSGRARVNINGAYNVENSDVIVTKSQSINSDSTLELFDTIIKKYGNKKGTIYLICDNAKYYKSKIIQEALQKEEYSHIEIIFLPPYAPNLNPIERVWKFFKKKVLKNKFYQTFQKFKDAIDEFFNQTLKEPKMVEKLRRFATDNFHIHDRDRLCLLPLESYEFKTNYFGR